jgi:hypothetical protein
VVRPSVHRAILTGVLTSGNGQRIIGARLTIEVLAVSGRRRSLLFLSSAVTDASGRYSATVPVRGSEAIGIRYRAMSLDPGYAAGLWRRINVETS